MSIFTYTSYSNEKKLLTADLNWRGKVIFLLSMLRKKEKQTLTRLFLLGVGAPIGLDRFYEGDVTGGFLAILGFLVALITVVGLLVWILPFISKTFRLLREFEDAED